MSFEQSPSSSPTFLSASVLTVEKPRSRGNVCLFILLLKICLSILGNYTQWRLKVLVVQELDAKHVLYHFSYTTKLVHNSFLFLALLLSFYCCYCCSSYFWYDELRSYTNAYAHLLVVFIFLSIWCFPGIAHQVANVLIQAEILTDACTPTYVMIVS